MTQADTTVGPFSFPKAIDRSHEIADNLFPGTDFFDFESIEGVKKQFFTRFLCNALLSKDTCMIDQFEDRAIFHALCVIEDAQIELDPESGPYFG